MGSTVTVKVERLDSDKDGHYDHNKQQISISKECNDQALSQTFWHEFVHCALSHLGYCELNSDEQFVEQMGQCLHQFHKTKKGG
jgi:hypothetical protein